MSARQEPLTGALGDLFAHLTPPNSLVAGAFVNLVRSLWAMGETRESIEWLCGATLDDIERKVGS